MRRAIIHVGMPRTGSTTIQHIVAHKRAELARTGVLYPDLTPASAAHEPHISHQHFGEALDGRRPRREQKELLQKLSGELESTDADVVLLSYEDFFQERRAADIASLLRSLFGRHGFTMEAIVVAKPQSEHLNSVYSHRLQMMRERKTFGEFAGAFQHSGRLAYHALLQPWLGACDGRIRAVPLRDRRSTAPLIERFAAELGLWDRLAPLLAAEDHVRVENRSPGPVAAEVSRRLRVMRVHARLRVRPRDTMRAVEKMARQRGFDAVAFKGVGPDLRARMDDRCKDANDRFADAVWGRPWAEVVAPEPPQPVNEIAGRPVDPATERVIESILHVACREFGVAPSRPWLAGPTELMIEGLEGLRRTFRISGWRVT